MTPFLECSRIDYPPPKAVTQSSKILGGAVKKKLPSRLNEKSFVLFAPDEYDQKKLDAICRKYNKTEEEVLSAAFRVGFPLLEFLEKNPSSKT
jgi:hypothetical protein